MKWAKNAHHCEDITHGSSVAHGGLARWLKAEAERNMAALESSQALGQRF